MHDDLATAVHERFPQTRALLEELVRIPSVSAGESRHEVRRAARATAELATEAGFNGARLLELDGAHPAVFAEIEAPAGAPTVLLYAHHDVQPPGPAEEWGSAPFEPTERDGRLYGRGSADDKGGIAIHLGAVGAFDGRPPVGVKLFVEGEEEIGSHHLEQFLDEYRDLLECDVIVIADVENIENGRPSLTTSLRGLIDCVVEVRTLAHAAHSGRAGGPVPDALMAMSRLIASLHHDDGEVAVDGLVRRDAPSYMPAEWWRATLGIVPGGELIGHDGIESRLWMQPAISVTALDAPRTSEAINQIVPAVKAKVSMRIAPGQDVDAAMEALTRHLEDSAPWGAEVTVTRGSTGRAYELDTSGPAYDAFREGFRAAWGTETAHIGCGGTIPFVAAFHDRFPGASILLTGVSDHISNTHAPDESVDLADLEKAVLAEAVALRLLAG